MLKLSSKPHPNQKMALAIKLADFLKAGIAAKSKNIVDFADTPTLFIDRYQDNNWLFDIQPFLLNRAWCETDNRFIQILPYVSLLTKDKKFPSGVGIFTYQRGVKGTESELHGDYSVGLGGHIEDNAASPLEFFNVVAECLGRELWEEVQFDVSHERLMEAMSSFSFLYDTTRPVDSVHLCMHFIIVVDEKDLGANEDGKVDKGQFVDLGEMIDANAIGALKFEQWSKVLLQKEKWDRVS